MKPLWVFALVLAMAATTRAELSVPEIFSSGAVLQRGVPVPVWGNATAGDRVTVKFAGQSKSAVADASDKWTVQLDPLKASAEPRPLVISAAKTEKTIQLDDVLCGDVWLCAGQSNMGVRLPEANGGADEIASAPDPLLRSYRVPHNAISNPRTLKAPAAATVDFVGNARAEWVGFSERDGSTFSATAYFFGKRLRKEIDVPIGLVVPAWGGSTVAAWMSPETLASPELRGLVPREVIGWPPHKQPSKLYNGLLRPVLPFAVCGVVWYQGESDAEPAQNPFLYRVLFPKFIEDVRRVWGKPNLPFYFVQLHNLKKQTQWTVLRESQSMALTLPATGMIPTLDIGDEAKLHPANKRAVGDRMAALVLGDFYKLPNGAAFPTFETAVAEGNSIRVSFTHAAGLKTTDNASPAEFEVAGDDGVFKPAETRIDGESVLVTSSAIAKPAVVRYAWKGAPKCNLVNAGGWPAVAFRTDRLPVIGQDVMPIDLPSKSRLAETVSGVLITAAGTGWTGIGDEAHRVTAALPNGSASVTFPETDGSQAAGWESPNDGVWKNVDASRGATVEFRGHVSKTSDVRRGLELSIEVPAGNDRRRYRVVLLPTQLHAMQEEQARIVVSDTDLSMADHTCRVAIRADGVAHVYFDGALVGTVRAESSSSKQQAAGVIRIAEFSGKGPVSANIASISVDVTGAYAP